MFKKMFVMSLIVLSLCAIVYAESISRIGTYTSATTTTAKGSSGANAITYQISFADVDSVDTLTVYLEGSLVAATNSGYSNLDEDGAKVTIVDPSDSTLFIRYNGMMPFTRLVIEKFVGQSTKSITVDCMLEK